MNWLRLIFPRRNAFAVLVVLILIVASRPSAVAFIKTGNDMLAECAGATAVELGKCDGYIEGIASAMSSGDPIFGWRACFPKGVTFGQEKDATLQYLQLNIGERQKGVTELVAAALAETFPCH